MSYDLRVWTSREPDVGAALPTEAGWVPEGGSWAIPGRGWQVVVTGTAAPCDWEDVPEEAERLCPGLAWLLEIHVEPLGAPASARKLALAAAKAIATCAAGVVEDPQQDTWTTPAGTKRFSAPARETRFSVLEMSWWFLESPILHRQGLANVLDHCTARFPEALPRRFGPTEPERFKYVETGRDQLLDLWEKDRGNLRCWVPTRPVVSVSMSADSEFGPDPRGFRANTFSVSIELDALLDPGWARAVRREWRALSQLLAPFYGDARVLHGFVGGRGGKFWIGRETESHPVRSWWWGGIPTDTGVATCLGEPYLSVWPAFATAAEQEGPLRFLESEDWTRAGSVADGVGGVPAGLKLVPRPGYPIPERYPPIWPFEPPVKR